MKKSFLFLVAFLLAMAQGAWAQTEVSTESALNDALETTWTLGYAENRLVDQDGYLYRHATEKEDQQALGWFSSQHIAGEDDEAITTPVNEGYTDEPARARKHD
jgi:hypothetical protein